MPANMLMVITPMMDSVLAAFRLFGRLKLGTPLLTASTPVNAVQPWENARNASSSAAAPAAECTGWTPNDADSATGRSPITARHAPQPIIAKTTATKPYVGIANTVPDSLTPRKFITASSATKPSDMATAAGRSIRNAEVIASTPAATDTATVST